jgi:hypothetical protein
MRVSCPVSYCMELIRKIDDIRYLLLEGTKKHNLKRLFATTDTGPMN